VEFLLVHPSNQLKLIGLTGGAGSGKATVAAMFCQLGAAVVDADQATHAAYEPGTRGFRAGLAAVGAGDVRGGQIDRARWGELVFRDERARRKLNAIVHPLVREWMAERTVEAAGRGAEIVIQDVPLLLENDLQGLFSAVVLAYVPPGIQLERLMGRGVTRERAAAIMAAQMPIDEKTSRADFVVANSASREKTLPPVQQLSASPPS